MPVGPSSRSRPWHRFLPCVLVVVAGFLPAGAQVHDAGEPGLEPPVRVQGMGKEPAYPEAARRDGIQGTVILRLVVTAQGTVSDVEVFRSPFGGEALAEAAMEAARTWIFEPARLDGSSVACRIVQTVPFHAPVAAETRSRRGKKKQKPPEPVAVPSPEPAPQPPAAGRPAEPTLPPARRPADKPAPPTDAPGKESPVPGPVPSAEAPAGKTPAPEEATPQHPPAGKGAKPDLPAPETGPRIEPKVPDAPVPVPGPVPVPPSRPAPPADAIDVTTGGPHGIFLGLEDTRLRELFPAAVVRDGRWRLPHLGMELEVDGSVRSIHYFFSGGADLEPATMRTRKGLGGGSSCLGVVPAYGRPHERTAESVTYVRAGTTVRFFCRDGRLAELVLEATPSP